MSGRLGKGPSAVTGTLTGRAALPQRDRLALARLAWLLVVVPAYALFVLNLPGFVTSMFELRSPQLTHWTAQLTLADRHTLQTFGASADGYALAVVAIILLFQVSYASVGLVLFLRKSHDAMALYASFALMMFPFALAEITLQALPAEWIDFVAILSAVSNSAIMIAGFVFPDGRFVPPWTRLLAALTVAYWGTGIILPPLPLPLFWLDIGVLWGLIAAIIAVQWYRFRYTSGPAQRDQTKWVVFGTLLALGGNVAARAFGEVVLRPLAPRSDLPLTVEIMLVAVAMLILPPAIGIAILRARLWDIDVIINRALVYSALTAVLALIYFSTVFILQFVVRALIKETSEVSVAASALAVAALFQPVRTWLQRGIDRRFYRRKYDAARTLAAFRETLRYEFDLRQLSDHLETVVQETMQPGQVSVWLRPPDRERRSTERL